MEDIKFTDVPSLIEDIINKAIEKGASDIHIEEMGEVTRFRFRIDGDLMTVYTINIEKHQEIITRIKILANLDIAEKRLPQDGRISWIKDRVDLRISVVPVLEFEKIVIRILDSRKYEKTLDQLDFPASNLETINKIIGKKSGMLISTGPTGCGKSTTLYSILKKLNEERVSIMTAEDPVEYKVEGLTQMQVNEKIGLSFARSLKSMLRSDPDVIMVGEIRDEETAEIAIRSAITGHLVLSTLHTFDSYSAIIRLLDMGIERYLLSSALAGIQSQRLVKKLCPHCSRPRKASKQELAILDNFSISHEGLKEAVGCPKCNKGYLGRKVISEIFEVDDDFIRLIKAGADIRDFRNLGREKDIKSMLEDGLEKASQGQVDISEVLLTVL